MFPLVLRGEFPASVLGIWEMTVHSYNGKILYAFDYID